MTTARLLICSLLACTLIAACDRDGGPPTDVWAERVGQITARWSAAPGLDLLRGVAVPVRGYLESRFLAESTGDINDVYAGFSEAVPPNVPRDSTDVGGRNRQPNTDYPSTYPLVGNLEYKLMSVNRTGKNVVTQVCGFLYRVAERGSDDNFKPLIEGGSSPTNGIIAMRLTLTAPEGTPEEALPPQEGPASSPSENVFGGWRIVGFLAATSPSSASQWPTMEADQAACVAAAPEPVERRKFLSNGEHPRSDFPTLPASPGWPEPAS
jgi:hypothetical protein